MILLKHKIELLEKADLTKALTESSWIMVRAAKQFAITERTIGYKIKKYGIRKEEMKSDN